MKLTKAVEVLTAMREHTPDLDPLDTFEALNLGIDALERIQHFRNRTLYTVRSPLFHEETEPRYPKNSSVSPENP